VATAEDHIGINAVSSHIGMEFLNINLLQTSQFQPQAIFGCGHRFTFKDLIDGAIIILEINSLAFLMHNGT
jgi:hypothetical protein